MSTAVTPAEFWADLEAAVDPAAYKPARNPQVVAARLEAGDEPYYVLKQPAARAYLRLSEADFALWWQMDGRKTVKALLLYSLRRYRTLPIGRLQRLIAELHAGHFLQDAPTNLYDQIETALAARAPGSRGRRILQAFLHTEFPITGLDDFFTPLYRRLHYLFAPAWQAALALLILVGGLLFGRLVWQEQVALTAGGGWSLLSLLAANLLVIGVHELAHGLTVKHYRRELHRGGFLIYWGFPAFFVDTRDVWLSPRRARIAVSWAGPHSGLVVGGLVGVALTAVALSFPNGLSPFWSGFLFQIGFIAYLSVFINLNPLLELDGYFILMDWLDMPDLRGRALRFWRDALWQRLRAHPAPRRFWAALSQEERVFTLFGGLALAYGVYALALAAYFWQTRLTPLVDALWSAGAWGRGVVLLATAVLVAPALLRPRAVWLEPGAKRPGVAGAAGFAGAARRAGAAAGPAAAGAGGAAVAGRPHLARGAGLAAAPGDRRGADRRGAPATRFAPAMGAGGAGGRRGRAGAGLGAAALARGGVAAGRVGRGGGRPGGGVGVSAYP
jgi:putative peptide zinc metalloprotease protein